MTEAEREVLKKLIEDQKDQVEGVIDDNITLVTAYPGLIMDVSFTNYINHLYGAVDYQESIIDKIQHATDENWTMDLEDQDEVKQGYDLHDPWISHLVSYDLLPLHDIARMVKYHVQVANGTIFDLQYDGSFQGLTGLKRFQDTPAGRAEALTFLKNTAIYMDTARHKK